jgi:hypothetical protein
MLINANKREEEEEEEDEEDGLRRENGGGSGVLELKRVTRDEKRIYKRERTEKLSSRVSPRRNEILWKFFHLSPPL